MSDEYDSFWRSGLINGGILFSAKPNELSLISGRRDGFERRDSIDMPSLDEEEGDETDRKVSSFYCSINFLV